MSSQGSRVQGSCRSGPAALPPRGIWNEGLPGGRTGRRPRVLGLPVRFLLLFSIWAVAEPESISSWTPTNRTDGQPLRREHDITSSRSCWDRSCGRRVSSSCSCVGQQGHLSRLSLGAMRGPHRLAFRELHAYRGLAYGSTPPPESLEFYPRDPGLCSWKIAVGTMWPARNVATGTCPAIPPLSLPTWLHPVPAKPQAGLLSAFGPAPGRDPWIRYIFKHWGEVRPPGNW